MPKVRLAASLIALLVLAYGLFCILRPLPAASIALTPPVTPALVKVNIPWPASSTSEQTAYGADGYGLLAQHGPETPVPTASVAKVITALAVLQKKPIESGETGPTITLTAHDVDIYNQYVAKDGSVVPVTTGETMSQYEALQALMLPSANNIADTLAEWAFGSIENYNIYANNYVKQLGMTRTTINDPSGYDPETVSTASDLIRLGDAALDNPVLSSIFNQKSVNSPTFGTIRNVNVLLGQSGIRGIKTGNTDEAGGCFLGAADVTIGGKTITVITAIMSAPNLGQALRDTVPVIQSSQSQFQTVHIVDKAERVGRVTTAWGTRSDIVASKPISVTAWTGTTVTPKTTQKSLPIPAPAGAVAGSISLDFNKTKQMSELTLAQNISSPSVWWRLSHPL